MLIPVMLIQLTPGSRIGCPPTVAADPRSPCTTDAGRRGHRMALSMSRTAVLAYRAAAHGLPRPAVVAHDVPGLGLGVQDSPPGNARLALASRTRAPVTSGAADEDPAWWDRDR